MALCVRLCNEREMPARALARELEGEAVDALDATAREGRHLHCDLVAQAHMHAPARARVFAFGVLAHDDPVDLRAVLKRRRHAGEHARRPHVRVLVVALADLQAQAPERDMVGHVGRAHGAEEDRIKALQPLEAAVGNVLPGFEVALGAPVEVREFELEAIGRALQHLDARGDYLVADAIAGNRGDAVRFHAGTLDCARTASATAAPTSAVLALPFMSGVCGPSRMTRSTARTTSAAAARWPRCSSISAPDQMVASGLAILRPAISGAEPCTGSKIDGAVRSGLILPEAAMPIVPAVAGPRSEMMSPT